MADYKIDQLKIGSTTYDIDLPKDADPTIASLTINGQTTINWIYGYKEGTTSEIYDYSHELTIDANGYYVEGWYDDDGDDGYTYVQIYPGDYDHYPYLMLANESTAGRIETWYQPACIKEKDPNSSTYYTINIPRKSGTFALTKEVINSAMSLSTVAGSWTLSTRWYVTSINGITTVEDGMSIIIKIPSTRSSSLASGTVLSIGGNVNSNYHPIVYNNSTLLTTNYNSGSVKLLTYDANATATAYLTSGTATTITGVWQCEGDYNTDTNTYVRQYQYNAATTALSGTKYSLLTRYNQTDKGANGYDETYARFTTNTYIDMSDNTLFSNKLKGNYFTIGNGDDATIYNNHVGLVILKETLADEPAQILMGDNADDEYGVIKYDQEDHCFKFNIVSY